MNQIAKSYPQTIRYILALSARAGIVGAMNATHLLRTGEVTKRQNWQRAANLSSALFAVVAATGNQKATKFTGLLAVGIGAVTAIQHAKDLGIPHEEGIRKL
ncbi:hypothetical protein KBC77_00830 [Candidatus Saccharibacteria bacterium]|nr:hypothetical protein [Candidatus Saccharibacteria bacterium]